MCRSNTGRRARLKVDDILNFCEYTESSQQKFGPGPWRIYRHNSNSLLPVVPLLFNGDRKINILHTGRKFYAVRKRYTLYIVTCRKNDNTNLNVNKMYTPEYIDPQTNITDDTFCVLLDGKTLKYELLLAFVRLIVTHHSHSSSLH
jgi:hypothetical protein